MSAQDPWAALGAVPVNQPAQATTALDPWTALGAVPVSEAKTPSLASSLAYKRETSRMQAEANMPQSTPWSRARELALGAAEGIGLSPQSSISGQAGNILQNVYGMIPGAVQAAMHPLTAAQSVGKALIAGPQQVIQAMQSGDYDAMAHGMGQTISADLPVVYGAGKAASGAAQIARVGLAGGPQGFIEQMLKGPIGGTAAERQTLIARLSPTLSRDVEVLKARTLAAFDKTIWQRLKDAKAMLSSAEASIPTGTTVPKAPLLNDVDALMDKYRVAGQPVTQQVPITTPGQGVTGMTTRQVPQYVSVNQDALNLIEKLRDEIAKFPDNVAFEDLRDLRQKLDKVVESSSGWRETGNAADKAQMLARKDVVNTLRQHLGGISPNMDLANAAYGKASDLMEAANLNYVDGRRIGTIGAPTAAQKALRIAAKTGLVAAGLGTAEQIYRKVTTP
jgi:hypothetical protein